MTDTTATAATTAPRRDTAHVLRGLGGMLAVELRTWFPWRWLILTLTGLGLFAMVYVPWSLTDTNQLGTLEYTFMGFWIAVMLLATVSLTEGSMLGEIERGTASWLVALPISRPSVVVAKFIGAAIGVAAVVLSVGGAVYPILDGAATRGITEFTYGTFSETVSAPIGMWGRFTTLPEVGSWLLVLAAVAALLVFVAAVMLLLGTVLRARTLVFGLGLAVVGVFGVAAIAGSFAAASPAGLIGAVADALTGEPAEFATPLAATALLTLAVLSAAAWRFARRELP